MKRSEREYPENCKTKGRGVVLVGRWVGKCV
jgi:hypothetical protein